MGRLRAQHRVNPKASPSTSVTAHVDGLPWLDAPRRRRPRLRADRHRARPAECRGLVDLYDDDTRFRSTIDMARHRFGEGPVPVLRTAAAASRHRLRAAFWPHLLPIARDWAGATAPAGAVARPSRRLARTVPRGRADPPDPADAPLRTRATGTRCTATCTATSCSRCRSSIGLDVPGVDYTGGEFVVVEQRPRAQSRATAHPRSGKVTRSVFTTRDRPVRSARGWSAAPDAARRERAAVRTPPHARPRLPRFHVSPPTGPRKIGRSTRCPRVGSVGNGVSPRR